MKTDFFYGGIEAGGTKINCAIGNGPNNIVAEARIPTTTPTETIAAIITFFGRTKLNTRYRPLALPRLGRLI